MANSETEGRLANIAADKRSRGAEIQKWEGDYLLEFPADSNTEVTKIGNVSLLNAMAIQNIENDNRNLTQKYLTYGIENVYGRNQYITGTNFHGLLSIFNNSHGYEIGDGRIADDNYGLINDLIVNVDKNRKITRKPDSSSLKFFDNLSENIKQLGNKIDFKYSNFSQIYSQEDWPEEDYYSKENQTTNDFELISEYDELSKLDTRGGTGNFDNYKTIRTENQKGLLRKTSALLSERKIKTPIAGFFTGEDKENGPLNTAYRETYGYSRGRNLLAKNTDGNTNGYSDPYCRVWTYHKQYSKVSDLIRPFKGDVKIGDIQNNPLIKKYRADYSNRNTSGSSITNGSDYLSNNTVLNDNGFVNITPNVNDKGVVSLKRCMFSIENLAWKGSISDLEESQKGENGGRIMWFPPYGLSFVESVSAEWSPHRILGRGENIYTYSNTTRTGQLSFILLADHPSIVNSFAKFNGADDEDDILRFFAGCAIPDKITDSTPQDDKTKTKTGIQDEGLIPNEDGYKLNFSIYFPNNYSGKDDNLWVEYLLAGRNAKLYENEGEKMVGYEMSGKQISDTAITGETIYSKNGVSEYFYKVDKDKNQVLKKEENYIDQKAVNGTSSVNSDFVLNVSNDYSFGEFGYAYLKEKKQETTPIGNFVKTQIRSEGEEKANEIYTVLRTNRNNERLKIVCRGIATNQDEENAPGLAKNRAESVKKVLMNAWNINSNRIEVATGVTELKTSQTSVNTLEAKKSRRVDVEITYFDVPIQNMSEVQNSLISPITHTEVNPLTGKKEIVETKLSVYKPINAVTQRKTYESEWDYFQKLEKTDPFLFKQYKDKVKFFNPAFHSMSPEGLNARLTFLQQCTRQGQTRSNDEGGTAGNLAFGRMPVCVLKLGDFFNSRIIISSVSLSYNNGSAVQWDLNPEGIGVQPMYVKVELGITILGGQSLEGPVSRLQNAVSFDYYANTGVYDNRSTRKIENGNKYSTWSPNEPNMEAENV